VPLDEKGQLRCNHFFDGRQKMWAFQDSHYAAMQHLGLERGIKGSVAKHQDIKDFYRIVEEGRDLEIGSLSPEQRKAKAADRDRAVQKKAEMEETAKRLVKENEAQKQHIQQLEQENQQLRTQLDQLRDLPLEDVAWHLGLTKTKDGKWKGGGHIISIDEPKWYDFAPSFQKGGGGAIDLVMYVNNCQFFEAVAWLRDRFGSGGMLKAATHHAREQAQQIAQSEPAPQFTPPREDESQWPAVQQYLIQKRGLPENMVQALYSRRFVYADSNQNAVFRMRSLTGETTGAFKRGTRGEDNSFMGYARGTKRADGWFYLRLGGKPDDDITRVVITKSPIDALSLAAIEGMPQQKTMYLVASCTKSLPVEYLRTIPTVIAAYDSDDAGDEMAQAIQEQLPQTERMRPIAKDWNSELLARLRQQQKQKNRGIER
jgi:flagellar motor protein MotB